MPLPNVTFSDIKQALIDIGLQRGDLIYVASFLAILGNRDGLAEEVIDALLELVGPEGTVIMPTFNFSFCHGAKFHRDKTESQTGVLSEAFRQRPDAKRMIHPPYHSVSAVGRRADEVAAIKSHSSFGQESVYQWMYDQNAKHLLLGCNYEQGIPHLHWLEEMYQVPYRFWKQFRGPVWDGDWEEQTYYMFARRLDVDAEWGDVDQLCRKFENTGKVKLASIGLGQFKAFELHDFYDYFAPQIQADRLLFLKDATKPFYHDKYSPIKGVHHIGLASADGNELTRLMNDFGFHLIAEGKPAGADSMQHRFDAANISIDLLDGANAANHIAFEVDNLQEAIRYCKQRGYVVAEQQTWGGLVRKEQSCFLAQGSTPGLLVELVQTAPAK